MKLAALALTMIAATAPAEARERHREPAAILDSYSLPNPILTPARRWYNK